MTTSDPEKKVKGIHRLFSGGRVLACVVCGLLASLLLALVLFGLPVGEVYAGGKKIKFATLAPEGSNWMKQMRALEKSVKSKSDGDIAFKFYPGGVAGDEKDVIRKMRIGQIHAAGFTGVGLGQILPEVRVLDLPFLFKTDKEIAHVYEKMTPHFAKAFEKEGYVLLGWVPVGWVHFFSKQDISTADDLKRTKAWMWQGDPLVQATYEVLKVQPHPLSITDVLMSLQTGMIDTVYASPMGALALQWFSKVKSMSQIRMGNATGAVLISKRGYKKLDPNQQALLKKESAKYLAQLVKKNQQDNNEAIEVMQKNGLQLTPLPSQAEIDRFHVMGGQIRDRLTGKLFPKSLLDQVLGHLAEVR